MDDDWKPTDPYWKMPWKWHADLVRATLAAPGEGETIEERVERQMRNQARQTVKGK